RPREPRGAGRHRAARAGMAGHGASLGRRGGGAPVSLDAVGLEVMGHAFASIAEEMGLVLIHSAVSPNIRERRDCSAALFDADGEMIAQAAHIPVHLGAMAESVAAVRALDPPPKGGELFLLNDPYTGGSHLPDLTVSGAIAGDGGEGLAGFSVVRAHHSDVGGVQAGSMPAGAREIFAEGVIVPAVRLTTEVERFVLANVRTPAARAADLAAQRAAVERGAEGLRALAARYGWAETRAAAQDLMAYAERRTRAALRPLEAAGLVATDWLEGDGVDDVDLPIVVRVDVRDGVFHADFTGTAAAARGNVNCPLAVARSAVLFVVRTLLPEDIPTNGGVSRAVRVTAPAGCLVNARSPSARAAGNVQACQRTPDAVVAALAGGDGGVCEFGALAPMELSVLAERRRHAPGGAAGGGSGAPGRTVLNGAALAPKVSALLEPGDVVRIETPGGGGWGAGGEPERG